ncbi:glutathione S-transferase N-terminal domain-containing protein [Neisseria wadsworthii]|uniref:glutathione S-transferase N-terminal domain-containing protein n=1 Tax=Neisseria wadsworthii TaxID=607711 RepID=UPI0015F360D8|nr:glutathione S-transferase N-terminal domain-containing protein [Neisseria wadsworthii]QMT34985.1 glutathione S-transferase N-terminal domain-containing protein [Neisseria wadsworthii]
MQLYLSHTSPFARLCLVRALLLQQNDLRLHFTNPWDNPADLAEKNPFGQIPVLETDAGITIYNTHLICQYLHHNAFSPQDLAVTAYATSLLEISIQALKLVRFKAENSADHPLVTRCLDAVRRALPQAPELDAQSREWPQVMLGIVLLTVKLRYPDLFTRHARSDTAQAVALFEQLDFVRKTDPAALEVQPATIGDL